MPACVDSEPPVFMYALDSILVITFIIMWFRKCPTNPIYVQSDDNGQLKPVMYEIPQAVDNSGKVVTKAMSKISSSSIAVSVQLW